MSGPWSWLVLLAGLAVFAGWLLLAPVIEFVTDEAGRADGARVTASGWVLLGMFGIAAAVFVAALLMGGAA